MKRDVSLYVADILENMDEAERFVGTMSYDEFVADRKTAYAVVRCFEIMGEAVKNVPEDVRALCPAIPWSAMAGMRDKCIHFYFGVKYLTVWTALKEELPQIKPILRELLGRMR